MKKEGYAMKKRLFAVVLAAAIAMTAASLCGCGEEKTESNAQLQHKGQLQQLSALLRPTLHQKRPITAVRQAKAELLIPQTQATAPLITGTAMLP